MDMCWERERDDYEKCLNAFTKQNKYEDIISRAILGEKCIRNTIALIEHYKPKFWYIENPQQSLMWKWINKNTNFQGVHYMNLALYSNYSSSYPNKPTYFLSNIEMDLKKKVVNCKDKIKLIGDYVVEIESGIKVPYNPKRKFNKHYLDIQKKKKMGSCKENSETNNLSSIPKELIKHIFSYFDSPMLNLFSI